MCIIRKAFFNQKNPALMTILKNNNEWDKSNAHFENNLVNYNKKEPKNYRLNTFMGNNYNVPIPMFKINPKFLCIEYNRFKNNYSDIEIELDNCKKYTDRSTCNSNYNCKYDSKTKKCINNYNYNEIKDYSIMKVYD